MHTNPQPKVGDVWMFPDSVDRVQRLGRIDGFTDYGMFARVTLANGRKTSMYATGARFSPLYKRLSEGVDGCEVRSW